MCKLNEITASVKGTLSKASWTIHKKKPEICLIASITATLVGVGLACRATVKAIPVMEARKKTIEGIEKCLEDGETLDADGKIVAYTAEDAKKDKLTINAKTAVEVGKLFVLPAAVIGGGIWAEVCGFTELGKRLAGVSAAYLAIKTKFDNYRGAVRDEYGADVDRKFFNGIKEKVEEVGTGEYDENGNEITTARTVMVADDDDYTAVFACTNSDGSRNYAWSPDMDFNLTMLVHEQDRWNEILRARKGKPVTLNEVRDRLGIPKTQTGQVVGWVYDPKNPKHVGDNQIIFGGLDAAIAAYKANPETPDDKSVVLEFNCDGNILYAM